MRELLRDNAKGFTLLEILAVIIIVGIISVIAIISVNGMIEKASSEVCNSNIKEVERLYESQFTILSNMHSDNQFKEFLLEFDQVICPDYGVISYLDGMVHCSLHSNSESEKDSDKDSDVPYL